MQLGRLDLQATLPGAGVLGEDVQDQLGPVDDLDLELALQVALLARAQVLVADDQVVAQFLPAVADLLDLAFAHEQRRLDLVAALDFGGDHLGAGGEGELLELPHLLVQRGCGGSGQEHAQQVGPFLDGLSGDQTAVSSNARIAGTGSGSAGSQVVSGCRLNQASWRRP